MYAASTHLDQGSPLAAVLAGKVGGGCSRSEQGSNSVIWGHDRWASRAIWVRHTHSGPPRRECSRWGHRQRRARGPRRPAGARRGRRTSWLPGTGGNAARVDAVSPDGRRSLILRVRLTLDVQLTGVSGCTARSGGSHGPPTCIFHSFNQLSRHPMHATLHCFAMHKLGSPSGCAAMRLHKQNWRAGGAAAQSTQRIIIISSSILSSEPSPLQYKTELHENRPVGCDSQRAGCSRIAQLLVTPVGVPLGAVGSKLPSSNALSAFCEAFILAADSFSFFLRASFLQGQRHGQGSGVGGRRAAVWSNGGVCCGASWCWWVART